eukprot:299089_1
MRRKLPPRPIYRDHLHPRFQVPSTNIQRKEIKRQHQHYTKRCEEPLRMNNHEQPMAKAAHDVKDKLASSSIKLLTDLTPPNLKIPINVQLATMKASVYEYAIKIGQLLQFVGEGNIAKEATHKILQFRVYDTHAKNLYDRINKSTKRFTIL